MAKYPLIKKQNQVQKTDHLKGKVTELSQNSGSFISFSYSYKSMSFNNGKTYVQSKKQSFQNRKLESEEFEVTMDGNVYMNSVLEMQNTFMKQITNFFKPFSMLLPFSSDDTKKR